MNQTKITINAIVRRINEEIKKRSESKEFLNEVENIVDHKLIGKEFSDCIEKDEFAMDITNQCIKQMVSTIMNNYILMPCKPREKINDKSVVIIKGKEVVIRKG
jgi:hypothetical protein